MIRWDGEWFKALSRILEGYGFGPCCSARFGNHAKQGFVSIVKFANVFAYMSKMVEWRESD
jgi:hypothetical protein